MTPITCAKPSPPRERSPSSPTTLHVPSNSPSTSISMPSAISWNAASQSSSSSAESQPASKRPPEITGPSSLSQPSSYGCDKCPRSLGRCADVGKCQRAQLFAVKINETQTPPMRDQARRQRIVAERAAAEVWSQAADIGERVDFDAQQIEFCAVGGGHLERDAAEAEKAHRIWRVDEAVDERRLDLVEIGLRRCRGLLPWAVRRLPLCHRTLGRMVVSGAAMVVMMVMSVIVAVTMVVIVAVLASPVHLGPQYVTGLVMIERWLPSLPWGASA